MESLGLAIQKLFKDLGIENKVVETQAITSWNKVVGKRIAEISQAVKIENNILFVKVLHSSWRNELLYQKKAIIDRLNKTIGKRVVEDIRLY